MDGLGLLDINKPRGDVFLDRLAERLGQRGRHRAALRQADVHQAGALPTCATRSPPSATAVIEALAD